MRRAYLHWRHDPLHFLCIEFQNAIQNADSVIVQGFLNSAVEL
jgi:hypothetical protein